MINLGHVSTNVRDSRAQIGGELSSRRDGPRREAEFTELYEAHYASIRAYASACVSAGDVDDIVAETFLVAWRRSDDIPADWPRGWLIGVARNVVRVRQRASRRATNFVDQLALAPANPQASADEEHLADQQIRALKKALSTLKDSDQEVLVLAGPYEFSLEEIALALDITSNAAGVRVHRARERLRAAFAKSAATGGEAA